MKSVTRNIITLLAPLAFLAMGSTAYATPTTSSNLDDLFIGFHSAGSDTDYLVDIGPASSFTASKTISLGIDTDLGNIFGGGWATDATIKWGIIGSNTDDTLPAGNDASGVVYASRPSSVTTPWSTTGLSTAIVRIQSMQAAYNGHASTSSFGVGLAQNGVSTASNNTYASFQPGGTNATTGASQNSSFARFAPTIEASNASGITAAGAKLTLYRVVTGYPAGTAVGTFTIDSSGTVTFTAAPLADYYYSFAGGHSLLGAKTSPTASPAGDGVQNMVKYVLGADPTTGAAQNLPIALVGATTLNYSFPFNSNSIAGFTTAVQYSSDLVHWSAAPAGTVSSGGRYSTVIPLNGATSLFTRMSVTQN